MLWNLLLMNRPSPCPRCGQHIPADAPEDLCPGCLMASGLPDDVAGATDSLFGSLPGDGSAAALQKPGDPTSPAPAGPTPFAIPAPRMLTPLFPNLDIRQVVGQGGMGAVYLAVQTKLDRQVALKIIRPEAANDLAFAERFNREARTLARLNHPNIVGVHDYGEVVCDGCTLFYFVMEYVDGGNLRHVLHADGVDPEQAGLIVAQVCEALQYAHDEGVVHRDIKPENILLDRRGRVKIADFGLARLVAGSADDLQLTGTHQVMGTPRYMAPEQMAGSRHVDHRADIYSLGVVYYEMLTGSLPLGSFDPPSAKTGSDPHLDHLVLKALASDPNRRFQQVSEFGRELYAVAPGMPTSFSVYGGDYQPWPGPSTILENAVGGAWNCVRDGRALDLVSRRSAPAVMAVGLAVLQLAGALLLIASAESFRSSARLSRSDRTIETFASVAGGSSFVLLLILFSLGNAARFAKWRSVAMLAVAAIATLSFGTAINLIAVPNGGPSVIGVQTLGLLFGGFAICTAGIWLCGAWELRRLNQAASQEVRRIKSSTFPSEVRSPLPTRERRSPQIKSAVASVTSQLASESEQEANREPRLQTREDRFGLRDPRDGNAAAELADIEAQAEIDGPALALLLLGILSLLARAAVFLRELRSPGSSSEVIALWLGGGMLIAALMIYGALHFRRCSSLAWARIGSFAACVPIDPCFLLTAIAGVYAKRTLDRSSVRTAFFREIRRRRQAAATEQRLSRKAAWGSVVAGTILLSTLMQLVGHSQGILRSPMLPLGLAPPFDQVPLILYLAVAATAVFCGFMGATAIIDIRRSAGRVTGFGAAFFCLTCLPILLLNTAMVNGLLVIVQRLSNLPDDAAVVVALSVGVLLSVLIDAALLIWLWRVVRPVSVTGRQAIQPENARAQIHEPRRMGTLSGVVELAISDIAKGNLPDVCMVCGQPATEPVFKTFQYQTKAAETMTLAGMFAGGLPGLLVAAATQKSRRICCPMCRDHRGHWSRLHWWAGCGWLIPVLMAGIGLAAAWVLSDPTSDSRGAARILSAGAGFLVGLGLYLIPLIRMTTTRISCQQISNTHVELVRVAPAFVEAVQMQSETQPQPEVVTSR